jgi:hypothetical protein
MIVLYIVSTFSSIVFKCFNGFCFCHFIGVHSVGAFNSSGARKRERVHLCARGALRACSSLASLPHQLRGMAEFYGLSPKRIDIA